LGLALAFNLAYLNLPVFNFIRPLSLSIKKKLASLSSSLTSQVKNTQWFRVSKRISTLCDEEDVLDGRISANWISLRGYPLSFFFNVFFLWKFGRVGSILSATYAAIFIFLGVIYNYGYLNPWFCYSGFAELSPISFSLLAMMWPIFCVTLTAWIKWSVTSDIVYNLKDLGHKAEDEAINTAKELENVIDSYIPQ
jgi:hypothetical protein